MDSQNFFAAINHICDEKKITREKALEIVKEALKVAYRKDFGNREQNLEVLLDPDSGRANILLVKTVVEKVVNNYAEIALKDARQIKNDIKVGAKIKIDVTPSMFGRIASQAAKQIIFQKVREAEQKAIYDEYFGREDELLNALVHRVDRQGVYLELDRTTAVLRANDQIRNERYNPGQRIKVYLEKVDLTNAGPVLHVSRTHPRLILRLLELEIPEVRNGTVVVKAIARDAGRRCKLVVDSTESNIDPVGACVGQRGARIKNITEEIGGEERIDVIEWSDDFDTLLQECLLPAKIDKLVKHEKEKRVEVYVREDQRAWAIGRNGQNVRLAGRIMGYEIDVLNTSELEEGAALDGEDKEKSEIKDTAKISVEPSLAAGKQDSAGNLDATKNSPITEPGEVEKKTTLENSDEGKEEFKTQEAND